MHPFRQAARRQILQKAIVFLFLLGAPTTAVPYSIQTHQQLIDLAWQNSIRPILLQHYPTLTEDQIRQAHSFAYGGSAIQDFGYYPFGNRFFSDLTHYVRTGDFVLALLRDARTPNELAFAIGAFSHFIGDTIGHSAAVNLSVPIEFPKLEQRYGASVNYAEDPHAHVQTEFAFDVNQLSKLRFAPAKYLRYVGLEISTRLLSQSFFETYGLNLTDIIGTRQTALRTYRFAARRFIPDIARAETILHKKRFPEDTPSDDLSQVTDELAVAAQTNAWERFRSKPGIGSHLFAGFIFVLPKFGTLKLLAIKGPTPQTEELYISSLNRSIRSLRLGLDHFDTIAAYLTNRDLDTGQPVKPGGYTLTDQTYAKLLAKITQAPQHQVPAQLKHDLIAYYADPNAPISTKKNPTQWAQVQANLKILATMNIIGDLDPYLPPVEVE